MVNYYLQNKNLLIFYLLIVLLGTLTGPLAYIVIPLLFIYHFGKQNIFYIFFGVFFILLLSDSRQSFFHFAINIKPYLVVLVFLFYLLGSNKLSFFYLKPFIPFFGIAAFSILYSPDINTSILKTSSYFIMLFIIPSLLTILLRQNKEYIIKGIVYFNLLIIAIGIVLYFIAPGIVIFKGDRYSARNENPFHPDNPRGSTLRWRPGRRQ